MTFTSAVAGATLRLLTRSTKLRSKLLVPLAAWMLPFVGALAYAITAAVKTASATRMCFFIGRLLECSLDGLREFPNAHHDVRNFLGDVARLRSEVEQFVQREVFARLAIGTDCLPQPRTEFVDLRLQIAQLASDRVQRIASEMDARDVVLLDAHLHQRLHVVQQAAQIEQGRHDAVDDAKRLVENGLDAHH